MEKTEKKGDTRAFKDKVIVVTGATAGVGRAVVREFARDGAKIAVLARGKDGRDATVQEVEELGGKAITISVDVADFAQVESAAERIEEELGAVDVWINNAMTSVFSPVREIRPEEFRRVTEVTYLGQVYGTLSALKRMLPRDRGTIILVGSALGYRGIPLQSAYCGAKHGIQGFFESLRSELIHDKSNVRLSIIQLPAMNTPQFSLVKSRLPNKAKPMGTIFQPEVAARAIYDAASRNFREKYVGYSTAQTILGNKLVPRFMDRYLASTGYKGQQTGQPEDPEREDNLWKPVAGDHGARGNFDDQAWEYSPLYKATSSRGVFWTALAAAGLGLGSLLYNARK
jgi:NAD(P)-dependent dehydrogenase (short-subunit alcohol dehydrogenase family)